MENFEQNPSRVKEKSVYLLHLDIPRIIIISSVIIGVIVVSFLFGMNFTRQGETYEAASHNNILFEGQKDMDVLDRNIAASPGNDTISKPFEEKIQNFNNRKNFQNSYSMIANNEKSGADILTNENINEIIPPIMEIKKPSTGKVSEKRLTPPKTAVKKKKKPKKNSRVVEVVSKRGDKKSRKSSHYSIQIASYDRKSKALTEVRILKDMKYDAYMNRSIVNGRKYYRVRIGPIYSKRKAHNLLNDIHEAERYEDSYMVRE